MQWDQAPELNARLEVRRALPEHYEDSELALNPTEVGKFVGQPLRTARNDAGTQQFWCTHYGCGHVRGFTDEKELEAHILSRHSPRPCFVDECTFTGLPPDLVVHARSAHRIVHIPRWVLARQEDWLKVHPYQCPVQSCYLYWRGCATRSQMSAHVKRSHWIGPENRLARDRYVYRLCAGFTPEFSGKNSQARLFEHLETAHQFSNTLPFNPMEPEVEDDEKASASPLNELKPPYSPSWPSDDDQEEDEENQEMTQMIHIEDDRPTHEADNVTDWMDVESDAPDWAV